MEVRLYLDKKNKFVEDCPNAELKIGMLNLIRIKRIFDCSFEELLNRIEKSSVEELYGDIYLNNMSDDEFKEEAEYLWEGKDAPIPWE